MKSHEREQQEGEDVTQSPNNEGLHIRQTTEFRPYGSGTTVPWDQKLEPKEGPPRKK